MDVIAILSGYVFVIALVDLLPKWKTNRKLFWWSTAAVALSYVLIVLASFGLYAPSPLQPFEYLVRAIFPK